MYHEGDHLRLGKGRVGGVGREDGEGVMRKFKPADARWWSRCAAGGVGMTFGWGGEETQVGCCLYPRVCASGVGQCEGCLSVEKSAAGAWNIQAI